MTERAWLTLGLLLLSHHLWAEQQPLPQAPPLEIAVFYSEEDPGWPAAREAVEAVRAKHAARVQVTLTSMDSPEGYRALLERQERLKLPPEALGDRMAFLGTFTLAGTGVDRREIAEYLPLAVERLLAPKALQPRQQPDLGAFAARAFEAPRPEVTPWKTQAGRAYSEVRAAPGGPLLGWIAEIQHPIACPVCTPAHFLVALDTHKPPRVLQVQAVEPLERWGKPLAQSEAQDFLGQFENRPLELAPDVDTISGATKTSRAYRQELALLYRDLHEWGMAE